MFTRLRQLVALCCAGLAFVFPSIRTQAAPATAAQPNVILILVDDMGATDLGSFGSKFYQTPNIDRLAARGMKFTQAYSACTVCSPTRASLLTGQYPARLRITDWIEGHKRPFAKLSPPDWRMQLPPDEMNLAKAFKSAGYATISIGKWHLGPTNCFPVQAGFDENVGGYNRGQPPSYFAPYKIPTMTEGPQGEYLTDREAAEASKFIASHREQRFFLYLPHYAVHTPIQSKSNVVARYRARLERGGPQTNAAYAALVESVDDSLGRIVAALEEAGLSEKTAIIFTSDNGGLLPITSNLGLRAGKGSAYEGGVRVPLIVHWPGVTKPGTSNNTPVITADFYPTLLELAGLRDQPGHVVDGESLAPLLRQTGGLKRDAIFWHYPHYHPGGATPYSAVREGDWKLVRFHETGRGELYNLKNDPKEQHDLAGENQAKAAALETRLAAWLKETKAQMPVPNERHDPSRDRK
jgi:arylsulfatase A-like enzyme